MRFNVLDLYSGLDLKYDLCSYLICRGGQPLEDSRVRAVRPKRFKEKYQRIDA